MNKFEKNLTMGETGIKAKRAKIVGSQAATAQEALINRLKANKNKLELTLDNLQDLSPDSTTSLVVAGGKDFDAANWVENVQKVKIDLLTIEVELQAALDTQKEWFSEEGGSNEQA